MLLRVELRKYAKKLNAENFESALYSTSVSIPLIFDCKWNSSGGGHWPRKGVWAVRPWRPSFHASPVVRKGPISSKRVSSQDLLLRKFGNFSLYSLNFHLNFSSQAPQIWKFLIHKPPLFRGKYQFTSPTLRKSGQHTPTWKKSWVFQIWKFSSQAPKFGNFHFTSPPPFSEANISSQAPHFGNPGRTPLPEKKLSAPPPGKQSWPSVALWT